MKLYIVSPEVEVSNEINLVQQMFELGISGYHLRRNNRDPESLFNFLEKLSRLLSKKEMQKIKVHAPLDLYAELQKEFGVGVHLKDDLDDKGDDLLALKNVKSLSRSFHDLKSIKEFKSPLEYAFISPIFNSISKQNYKSAFDLASLKKELSQKQKIPLVALGGIDASKISILKSVGFKSAAVMGTVWNSVQPVLAVEKLLRECSPNARF